MKTTIVVEDVSVATGPASVTADDARARESAPIDAGAAPTGPDDRRALGAGDLGAADGGQPPGWLVEAIARAGGLTTAASAAEPAADGGPAPA